MQSPQTLTTRVEYRGSVATLQQQGLRRANIGRSQRAGNATFDRQTRSACWLFG